jgi:hypothetical protein
MTLLNHLHDQLSQRMTTEKALWVKELRNKGGYTWRAISLRYNSRYPEEKLPNSQIIGREICNAAMSHLKETVDDGWN